MDVCIQIDEDINCVYWEELNRLNIDFGSNSEAAKEDETESEQDEIPF